MGANVAQQLITLGFVDELFIHLVPVLFGSEHVPLETAEVIETAEEIHLRFRVVK